jgi:hypothetical protein
MQSQDFICVGKASDPSLPSVYPNAEVEERERRYELQDILKRTCAFCGLLYGGDPVIRCQRSRTSCSPPALAR